MSQGHHLQPSIIREYDIRGVTGETLSADDCYAIGRTFASMVADERGHLPVIATARDGRLSSPELAHSLQRGMADAGATVQDAGLGPTPLCYFSAWHLNADAAVMLTGSHNPKSHNGCKFMLGRAPFYGGQVRELAQRSAAGMWRSEPGTIESVDVSKAYIDALCAAARLPQEKTMRVIWDAGNGATGDMCRALATRLTNVQSEVLFAEIDGHFPNHHPDPSQPENVADLAAAVSAQGAQLGVAFDGDGDRLGAVDDKGRLISPDHLLMLLARNVLNGAPGATIIADVKTSQMVFDDVADRGGKALMWMTGHSHIKQKMKQTNAAFGGEASGHLFFADRYFGFDDGLYAALRLIELTASLDEPLSALIDRLPRMHTTPELRLEVREERKFVVIDEIRVRLDAAGEAYLAIDGVRMQTPDGWWLIRASNTQAALIARAESATREGLARLVGILREQLSRSGVAADALLI